MKSVLMLKRASTLNKRMRCDMNANMMHKCVKDMQQHVAVM